MNNDLISREALKKTFDDYIKANPNVSGVFELGKFIIDNAPTVDTYTIEDIQTVREDALILGAKLAQRPQGEWIALYENDGTPIGCKCPYCDDEPQIVNTNFCPNCGADMRKGGAE